LVLKTESESSLTKSEIPKKLLRGNVRVKIMLQVVIKHN
jgi:hypothetical protein